MGPSAQISPIGGRERSKDLFGELPAQDLSARRGELEVPVDAGKGPAAGGRADSDPRKPGAARRGGAERLPDEDVVAQKEELGHPRQMGKAVRQAAELPGQKNVVGVQKADVFVFRPRRARGEGRGLALVLLVDGDDLRRPLRDAVDDLARRVGRAVVDDDDLEQLRGVILGQAAFERRSDEIAVVVVADDEAECVRAHFYGAPTGAATGFNSASPKMRTYCDCELQDLLTAQPPHLGEASASG